MRHTCSALACVEPTARRSGAHQPLHPIGWCSLRTRGG